MGKSQISTFNCPTCNALYHLIRVEAPVTITTSEREISCLKCGAPLQGRDGRFVLKYFFVDRSGKRRRRSL
jgi:transcription elongation factor Elf1